MTATLAGATTIACTTGSQRDRHAATCIWQRYQRLGLEPEVPGLGEFLLTRRARLVPRPDGVGVEWQLQSLVSPSTDTVSRIGSCDFPNAGLHEVVDTALKRRGFAVRNEVAFMPRLSTPSSFNVRGKPSADHAILDAVQRRSHTLVRLHPGVDRNWLIAQIALAYPSLKIAVACASHDQVKRISRELLRCRVGHRRVPRGNRSEILDRVVVGTFYGMADVQCEKRDVLIVPDARHSLSGLAKTCLMQADSRWRLVGMLAAEASVSREEHDQIITTFGVVAADVRRLGRETVLPSVLFVVHHHHAAERDEPVQHHPIVHRRVDLEALRRLIDCPIRNRRIGRLADQIARGAFAEIDGAWRGELIAASLAGRAPARTIILARSHRQAEAIHARLSRWQLFSDSLTSDTSDSIESTSPWPPAGFVISLSDLDGADVLLRNGIHVVIWAGGGRRIPQFPNTWLTRSYGSNRRVLVIDVDDAGESAVVAFGRHRRRAYRHAEWLRPGASVLDHRIDAFLRNRPRGNTT
jgi:hypothetical protein